MLPNYDITFNLEYNNQEKYIIVKPYSTKCIEFEFRKYSDFKYNICIHEVHEVLHSYSQTID